MAATIAQLLDCVDVIHARYDELSRASIDAQKRRDYDEAKRLDSLRCRALDSAQQCLELATELGHGAGAS